MTADLSDSRVAQSEETCEGSFDGEARAHAQDREGFLRELRAEARLYLIDDSVHWCEAVARRLGPDYPHPLRHCSNPLEALEEIAELASRGEIDVLIVDMDMPGLTGAQLILELNKRGINLPFVILSGRQGSEISRNFLTVISGVNSRKEFEAAVSDYVKERRGFASVFLAKEVASVRPEALTIMIDAMLLAGRQRGADLKEAIESLFAAGVAGTGAIADERKRICTSIYDLCQTLRLQLGEDLKKLKEGAGNSAESEPGSLIEHVEDLAIQVEFFCGLDKIEKASLVIGRSWDVFVHDVMGSRGVGGVISLFDDIPSFLVEHVESFRDAFRIEEERIYNLDALESQSGAYQIGSLIRLLESHDPCCPITVSGNVEVKIQQEYLKALLEQPIHNAQRASARSNERAINVTLTEMRYPAFPPEILAQVQARKNAFVQYDKDLQRFCMVEIENHGSSFPASVLDAFREGGEIRRGGSGEKSDGLQLMREMIEAMEGAVIIENTEVGAKVTLAFPAESPMALRTR